MPDFSLVPSSTAVPLVELPRGCSAAELLALVIDRARETGQPLTIKARCIDGSVATLQVNLVSVVQQH